MWCKFADDIFFFGIDMDGFLSVYSIEIHDNQFMSIMQRIDMFRGYSLMTSNIKGSGALWYFMEFLYWLDKGSLELLFLWWTSFTNEALEEYLLNHFSSGFNDVERFCIICNSVRRFNDVSLTYELKNNDKAIVFCGKNCFLWNCLYYL